MKAQTHFRRGLETFVHFPVTDILLKRVTSVLDWHRQELRNPRSLALRIPALNAWKKWDNNRLWCAFFFSVVSPGGSGTAREYLRRVDNGTLSFELKPEKLVTLSDADRLKAIWEFGIGKNALGKRLARFFSRPENMGARHSCEFKLASAFDVLAMNGFLKWFNKLDMFEDDRQKARSLEFLPGAKLKVSRDFVNNIGMTDSLIPLDVHILKEMAETWHWEVPSKTPTERGLYEQIEDSVRDIAAKVNCTVVEIDKAIFSHQLPHRT